MCSRIPALPRGGSATSARRLHLVSPLSPLSPDLPRPGKSAVTSDARRVTGRRAKPPNRGLQQWGMPTRSRMSGREVPVTASDAAQPKRVGRSELARRHRRSRLPSEGGCAALNGVGWCDGPGRAGPHCYSRPEVEWLLAPWTNCGPRLQRNPRNAQVVATAAIARSGRFSRSRNSGRTGSQGVTGSSPVSSTE